MAFNPYKFSWRYIKSYFRPEVWQRESTPYNPLLEVIYEYGKIKLNSENVNYSFGSLHVAFAETFSNYNLQNRGIKKALILGLGAGSIPAILSGYPNGLKMVGVEIDSVVIDLAKKYFNLGYHKNLDIVISDAVDFVLSDKTQNSTERYDLIAIDLFIDYEVPVKAETSNFLKNLENLMTDDGILIYNRLRTTAAIEASDNFKNIFDEVFPTSEVFYTLVNAMLVYDRRKQESARENN